MDIEIDACYRNRTNLLQKGQYVEDAHQKKARWIADIRERGAAALNEWQKSEENEYETLWLYGADFRGLNLRNANFSGVELEHADFTDADLRGANFQSCTLTEANLTNALLCDTNFLFAKMQNTHLSHADLTRAHLQAAEAKGAHFADANLHGACFRTATCTYAKFQRANLREADLTLTHLQRASFQDTCFKGATIVDANLGHVYWTDEGRPDPTIVWQQLEQAKCSRVLVTLKALDGKPGILYSRAAGPTVAKGLAPWNQGLRGRAPTSRPRPRR
jgi:uncharacterized protein YjbI with pentapeptide repeats